MDSWVQGCATGLVLGLLLVWLGHHFIWFHWKIRRFFFQNLMKQDKGEIGEPSRPWVI